MREIKKENKMEEKKFNRHETGRTLDNKKSHLFFQLGSRIQSIKSRQFGFLFDVDCAHQMALWALDKTGWKSMKLAKALLNVSHMI